MVAVTNLLHAVVNLQKFPYIFKHLRKHITHKVKTIITITAFTHGIQG